MKKGFTLVELLAVIVILGLIALITVPIVTRTINSSKKATYEISVKNYIRAIESAVYTNDMSIDKPIIADGTYQVNSAGNICLNADCTDILKIPFEGEHPVSGSITIENNKVTSILDLNYDKFTGSMSNGNITIIIKDKNETLYTGEIYRNSTEAVLIGDTIDNITYETNLSNISQNNYLKHEVVNNIVTASYACITYTENGIRKDVCLRGAEPTYYASNQSILRGVEPYFNTLSGGYCSINGSYSDCDSDSLYLYADSDGDVYAYDGSAYCYVNYDGHSRCLE